MKNFISLLTFICMLPGVAWADCDWSTGITPGPNHTFIYSDVCHLAVGNLIQANKVQAAQISDLTKAIQLKDLALTNSDSRIALWQKSSDDELSHLNTIQSNQKHTDWMYFGLGALTVIGSGWMVSKIIHN